MPESRSVQDTGLPDALTRGLFAVADRGVVALPASASAERLQDLYAGLPLGVYTVLRTHHHRRFIGLDRHLARLADSLRRTGDAYRPDEARLRAGIDAVCALATAEELRLRLDVLASEIVSPTGVPARELIGFVPLEAPPPAAYAEGVATTVVDAIRRDDPEAKTADFASRRRRLEPRDPGVFESLMCDAKGHLVEGLSSNLFTVRDGVLRTANEGMLSGVTRAIVLDLARERGIDLELRPCHRDELDAIDEAFLCSSSRAVVPIVRIDDTSIGDGRPGPITRRLAAAYESYVATNAAPAI